MIYKSIFFVGLIGSFSGCSDPNAASENNFKLAIQSYFDKQYPRCYVITNLPYVTSFDIGGLRGKLRALAKVGLVVESEGSDEMIGMSGTKIAVPAPKFELTEDGKKYYKEHIANALNGNSLGGFCAGKAVVTEITQFSEPADMLGQKVSQVHYKYQVSDLPSWTKSPELMNEVSELKTDVASMTTPQPATVTLVLTNHGWTHENMLTVK